MITHTYIVEIHLSRLLYAEEEADLGERSSAAEELQSNESINVSDLRNLKQKYERTIWKQKEYTMDSNTDFFLDDLMNSIVYQSNLYTCQNNPNSRDHMDKLDLQYFWYMHCYAYGSNSKQSSILDTNCWKYTNTGDYAFK